MKIKVLYLFLLCFFIYNINQREISSMDTLPSRYLPVSIIREFNLDLDEFPCLYSASKRFGYRACPEYDCPYYLQKIKNHYYSNYPLLIPILAVPVYFMPVIMGIPINETTVDILSKITAAILAGLSVLVLYLALIRIAKEGAAVLVSCIYAFATSIWSTASQGLWSHGAMMLFLALCAYCLIRGLKEDKYVLYSSIPLGLAVLSRQNGIIIAVVLSVYVLLTHRKYFLRFAGILVLFAGLLISYNVYFFGHIIGGNYYLQQNHHVIYYMLGDKGVWSAPLLEGLAGLLISPSSGLFIYSPILVFAFLGMFFAWRNRESILFEFFSISCIVYILFLSKFSAWWGGHCFGPRYLTDILPLLCIFIVFVMDKVLKNKKLLAIFVILSAYSVLVQLTGVFLYPSGWNNTLEDDNGLHREVLWKWKDSQLVWCIKRGLMDRQFLLEREKSGVSEAKNRELYFLTGDEIDFRKPASTKHYKYGWSMPEGWGVWLLGPESTLRVSFNEIKDKRVIIRAMSFRKYGRNQVMRIYMNGKLLKEHEFKNLNSEFEIIEAGLPGTLLSGGIEELKFTCRHFKRAALKDLRIISVGMESIKFITCEK